jgi:hypothetical protein
MRAPLGVRFVYAIFDEIYLLLRSQYQREFANTILYLLSSPPRINKVNVLFIRFFLDFISANEQY